MVNSAGDYVVSFIVSRYVDGKDWLQKPSQRRKKTRQSSSNLLGDVSNSFHPETLRCTGWEEFFMLGKVEICGVNTAELKVLSSDACRALLIRAKHGDTDAREQLIAGTSGWCCP